MAKKTQDTLKADLVVIGGGGSGLTAAAMALESGVKNIIIIEKRAKVGGCGESSRSAGCKYAPTMTAWYGRLYGCCL
jgi:glycine/D-amino acid oxidase-like deaminating enzyme